MDEDEGSEKPFEATPRKLEEARKRGEFPVSQDLVTLGVYLGILAVATMLAAWSLNEAGSSLRPFLASPELLADQVFNKSGRFAYGSFIWSFVIATAIWLVAPLIFALLSAFAQGALVFAPVKLKPKLSRISIISNAKQKYGADGLFNFFKSFAKLLVYSAVLVAVFNSRLNEILVMSAMTVEGVIMLSAELCFWFLAASAVVVGAFATIDFLWQRAQFLRRQRMSLKEVRDETKETEGDPHTKQARRQKAYDIATNQMLADVPDADVVVVNPEHYAVALSWERTAGSAPVCVAKGVDEIAARIREVANENAVPIYQDAPTARALFATTEIGDEIPVEHYRAIASAIRFADAMRKKAGHQT